MQTIERSARSGLLLYGIAAVWLVVGVTNLATFSSGGPISKWFQLSLGILSLVLAVVWLTWAVTRTRARSTARGN
jgi:uncharacterized membrane protein HdeD (DUF308 family)